MKDRPEALYDATVRFLQAQTEPDIDFEVGEPEGNMTTALAIKRRWKPDADESGSRESGRMVR